jgi:hypothetical protein
VSHSPKANKNGQPVASEPVVLDSTNGKRRKYDTGTVVFESKAQQLRYFEQTQGAKFIE